MKVLEFLQEANGQLSQARLFALLGIIVATVLTFTGGGYDLILTWLGVATGIKLAQKPMEK